MKYWTYAVQYASFVRNRVTTKNSDSPYFKRLGTHPNMSMLKEFGCKAYALNDDERRFKLGDKTIAGKFLGYSIDTGSPSALILTDSGKIIRSRDIVLCPSDAHSAQLDKHAVSQWPDQPPMMQESDAQPHLLQPEMHLSQPIETVNVQPTNQGPVPHGQDQHHDDAHQEPFNGTNDADQSKGDNVPSFCHLRCLLFSFFHHLFLCWYYL